MITPSYTNIVIVIHEGVHTSLYNSHYLLLGQLRFNPCVKCCPRSLVDVTLRPHGLTSSSADLICLLIQQLSYYMCQTIVPVTHICKYSRLTVRKLNWRLKRFVLNLTVTFYVLHCVYCKLSHYDHFSRDTSFVSPFLLWNEWKDKEGKKFHREQ